MFSSNDLISNDFIQPENAEVYIAYTGACYTDDNIVCENLIESIPAEEFTDLNDTPNSFSGQGNKIVKHWNFKGTHDGDFFGIPATGKKIDLIGTTLVLMKDGKILQEQDFFDNYSLLSQLGLTPTE